MTGRSTSNISAEKLARTMTNLRRLTGLNYRHRLRVIMALALLTVAGSLTLEAGSSLPNLFPFFGFLGFSATTSSAGSVNLNGPFFQSLGSFPAGVHARSASWADFLHHGSGKSTDQWAMQRYWPHQRSDSARSGGELRTFITVRRQIFHRQ
jgi:hypothetical protein